MSASALKVIKANYEARTNKLDELRKIDDAAKDRAYTPDEESAVTELRSALESIDSRIQENVKSEIRMRGDHRRDGFARRADEPRR